MSQTRDERIRHSPVRPKKERASYVSRTWGGLIAVPRGSPPWVQEVVVQVNQSLRKLLPFLDEDIRLVRHTSVSVDDRLPRFDGTGGDIQNSLWSIDDDGNVTIGPGTSDKTITVDRPASGVRHLKVTPSQGSTVGANLYLYGGGAVITGNVALAHTGSGADGKVGVGRDDPGEILDVVGNIAVSGTVDGRDVATDGTKLDGIESGATADQSDAEIKTAYENNSDTNAFTDAEKRLLKVIHLPPSGAWANTQGTATLVQSNNVPAYWEFLDNSAIDRITMSMPLPDYWAGRSLSKFEIEWSTDGTNTATMVWQVRVYNYVLGTDLLNGAGTTVYNPGSVTLTPTGTAHSGTRTDLGPSGTFSAGADVLRVLIQRRSSDASDTNTDALRIYGVRLEVS